MKIMALADLHLFFNRQEIDRYIRELNALKEDIIMSDIDLLVICGDTMHTNYNMDYEMVPYVFSFVSEIYNICKNKEIPLRIIKGTSSHDVKFVECLQSIYDKEDLIKCYVEPVIEKISIKGKTYKIRFLPESYGNMEKVKELNNSIFNQECDMTFFHGSIKSIMERFISSERKPTILPQSLIWEDEILKNTTKYFSAGGHIHENINVDDKIFYINSYTTHNFADKDTKGYMIFEISDHGFEWKRITNRLAPKYHTVYINDIHSMEVYQVEDMIKSKLTEIDTNDHVRFVISGILGITSNRNISVIKSLTKNYTTKITSNLVHKEIEVKQNNYDYTDINTPIVDKIHRLYNENYENVSRSVIEKAIEDNGGE